MSEVYLAIPSFEELKYRKKWLMDKETMSYNAGLDLDINGYNKEDGTINMSDSDMLNWYNKWINKEPDRYYAYVYVNNEPVGEVYYYPQDNTYNVGILVYEKYRGKGYAYQALVELLKIAFDKNKIDELVDMIPLDRMEAIKLFKKVGFKLTDRIHTEKVFDMDTLVGELILTREMYNNI